MIRVLMVGASRLAQMIATVAGKTSTWMAIDHLDDAKELQGAPCPSGKVVGTLNDLEKLAGLYRYGFVGIATPKLMELRRATLKRFEKAGLPLINIIHPSAVVDTLIVGQGNYIGAQSYIAPFVSIGRCNYFSAGTIIEHHSTVGDLNSWGPGNSFSGGCQIEDEVCMGTHVSGIWDIKIGRGSRIASGVQLHESVPANSIVRKAFFPDCWVKTRKARKSQ